MGIQSINQAFKENIMDNIEIRKIRLKLGLTQSEFCKKVGIPNRHRLSEYENNKRNIPPPVAKAVKYLYELTKALNQF